LAGTPERRQVVLAVTLVAIILVVVLFATAIIISMSGTMADNRRAVRRLNARLDRHIEANMAPEERNELYRWRRGNAETKRSLFEHGV
jgi:hypothetical protein